MLLNPCKQTIGFMQWSDSWILRSVMTEKEFYVGQVSSGGAALEWWESYNPQDREALTWVQFRERFQNHHVPVGVMKMKKKEFLALKQWGMTVTEYHDKFLQLARYAPREVAEDGDKQEHFLEGLNDALQYQLMNHHFPSFHDLVNCALLTERKRRDMEYRKQKLSPTLPGSNTHPRYQQQQQQYQSHQGYQQRGQNQQGYQQQRGQGQATGSAVPSYASGLTPGSCTSGWIGFKTSYPQLL